MATGNLREVVAHTVGGDMVLQAMINARKAVACMSNGVQFVRLVQHKWKDTEGLTHITELGGSNTGVDHMEKRLRGHQFGRLDGPIFIQCRGRNPGITHSFGHR